jgi:hypothetical protein
MRTSHVAVAHLILDGKTDISLYADAENSAGAVALRGAARGAAWQA